MRMSELASDLAVLRANLAEELQAVNRYEHLIDAFEDDDARFVVKRIVDTRKQNAAVLMRTIERLDPRQAEANQAAASS